MIQKYIPQKLPKCSYPSARDVNQHGLQQLPKEVTAVNWPAIKKYRSTEYSTTPLSRLPDNKILRLAHMVAQSFVKNEPMKRHLQPPQKVPSPIIDYLYTDPFGKGNFGEWTAANLVFWFIRLFILTKPSDPIDKIGINPETINLSLAILDKDSTIIGGAFNAIVLPTEEELRKSDPFLDTVLLSDKPIYDLLFSQEHEAIEALENKYPDFKHALLHKKVGLHFMVAKSPALPTQDAFELVAASAETFKNQGFKYMLTCASNQWTGAACEVLNGTQVHFTPYRLKQRVAQEANAFPDEPYSSDGFISDKDSGAMFYVIKFDQ